MNKKIKVYHLRIMFRLLECDCFNKLKDCMPNGETNSIPYRAALQDMLSKEWGDIQKTDKGYEFSKMYKVLFTPNLKKLLLSKKEQIIKAIKNTEMGFSYEDIFKIVLNNNLGNPDEIPKELLKNVVKEKVKHFQPIGQVINEAVIAAKTKEKVKEKILENH